MRSTSVVGSILVFVAAICFSAKAIMIKLAFNYQIDPLSLLFLRMVFSLPFFIGIPLLLQKQKPQTAPTTADYLKLGMLGILGYYASSMLDFLGLQYVTAGLERLILFVYPTIVAILLFVFFNKSIGRKGIIALILTYAGILLVFLNGHSPQQPHMYKGALLIFASACTYALYLVGSSRLIPKFGSVRYTGYVMMVSCASVIVHFLFLQTGSILQYPMPVYVLGISIALISTVFPTFMISEGIKMIGAGKAAIIGSVGPVATIILGYLVLHEPITWNEIFGTGLVLTGVLLVSADK
ncbi:DMT family transporter [Rhodocytophaga aerolata]|uniref:DMT family transporter n=1 Tax=Rhodocytophaga aerolata TaxID=455078 RepID=A0ABT8R1G9_9BACT|nr:DMT family transporter [Rhodocytophaga aerolata]MDO1445941.1 DMT family transporter [Rhodocytophaga aerolata]